MNAINFIGSDHSSGEVAISPANAEELRRWATPTVGPLPPSEVSGLTDEEAQTLGRRLLADDSITQQGWY